MLHEKFPVIKKTLADFIYEEEGNIPRSTMLAVRTMVLLLSVFYADDVFAAHRSHSSHSSHSSHKSHTSHSSHSSGTHSSHSSHSNENIMISDDLTSDDIMTSRDTGYSSPNSGGGGCNTGSIGALGLVPVVEVFREK